MEGSHHEMTFKDNNFNFPLPNPLEQQLLDNLAKFNCPLETPIIMYKADSSTIN